MIFPVTISTVVLNSGEGNCCQVYLTVGKQELEDPIEVSLESTLEWAQRLGETIEVSL